MGISFSVRGNGFGLGLASDRRVTVGGKSGWSRSCAAWHHGYRSSRRLWEKLPVVVRRVAARFLKKKRKSLGVWAARREREGGQNGGSVGVKG